MKLWQVIKAVLAAFIGVQSDKNRKEDFKFKSPLPFIIVGIILVIVLIFSLVTLVNLLVYLS